jgi:polysaccharide export outer membrane protein
LRAEIRLGAGDVVEVSIAGMPELRTRATVDLDGRIAIPFVGRLSVAGLSLDALHSTLRREMSQRLISSRAADGRVINTVISPQDIMVSIAEYRPVYLMGDLAKSGEVPYRPGLTVRQAIAIAGGYDIVRFRTGNPYFETVDFVAERTALSSQLIEEMEKERHLEAQLGVETTEEGPEDMPPNAKSPLVKELAGLIADELRTEQEDFEKGIVHLRGTAKLLSARAELLEEQREREEEGTRADSEEFERMQALLEKGTTSAQRVSDARRATLLSATRALQTGAEAAQVARDRDDIHRTVQKLQNERRAKLLADLRESRMRRIQIEARLAAVNEKLLLSGAVRSVWATGGTSRPTIVVHRNMNGTHEEFVGSEDTQLLPGDVVKIALRIEGGL